MLENYNDVLTPKNLYEILPVGRNTIYKLLDEKKIFSIRMGKKYLIPKEAVIDYLKIA